LSYFPAFLSDMSIYTEKIVFQVGNKKKIGFFPAKPEFRRIIPLDFRSFDLKNSGMMVR